MSRKISVSISNPEFSALVLVCRAQRPIILEVEVPRNKQADFLKDYGKWMGKTVKWQELIKGGFALDIGRGKWGAECRIYFVKDQTVKNQLERYGCRVENGDVRHPGTFRVNNTSLFRELIEHHGLQLGNNM